MFYSKAWSLELALAQKKAVVASFLGLSVCLSSFCLSSRDGCAWFLSIHLCENHVCHFKFESTPDIWRLLVPAEGNLDDVMKQRCLQG